MDDSKESSTNLATLAGGCFWCTEAVFLRLRGVMQVRSGYCNGHIANPTYQQVCGGDTGHAEAVQIHFDPEIIGYAELLEVFFAIHNPTTLNRQGHDIGSQYRSAIFTHSAAQTRIATEAITALNAAQAFPAPIVTEVTPAGIFYPAENYHQNYFAGNPRQPYCQSIVAPKVAKFEAGFAPLLK